MGRIVSKTVWVPKDVKPRIQEGSGYEGAMDIWGNTYILPEFALRTKKHALGLFPEVTKMTITLEVHDG